MNKNSDKTIIDEKTGIEYTLVGDYYLPNLSIPIEKKSTYVIGKYGRARQRYLQKHKAYVITDLLLDGKLQSYLIEIDKLCNKRVDELIESLKAKSNLTEDMKNTNPLYWVGIMNTIKNQAEEIIYNEIIDS